MLSLGHALRGNATPITLAWVTWPSWTNTDGVSTADDPPLNQYAGYTINLIDNQDT